MRIGSLPACAAFRKSFGNYAVSGLAVPPISAPVFFVLLLTLFGLIGASAVAQGVSAAGPPNAAAPRTFSDAVQVLAREQSAGEQYAVIFDRFGKKDMARYIEGIRQYAEAKADFDGLIEALKTDLTEGRSPDKSPKLAEALRSAAEKRIAFTSFVSDAIGATEGGKAALPSSLLPCRPS